MDGSVVMGPSTIPHKRTTRGAASSLSTWPCKAAARTAPSLGVFWTACSRTNASGSTASAPRVRAQ